MKELAHINKYFVKYKKYLLLGLLFTIISNVFAIAPAQIVRFSFDYIKYNIFLYNNLSSSTLSDSFYGILMKNILFLGALILIMALLRGFFLFLIRQTIIVMSRLIEYDLKNEIFAHYQKLPLSFYRQNNTGDLMARISEDVSRVRMYIGPAVMYGINLIVLFPMVIYIMFSVNTTLTLYSLIPLPILSISIYYVNNLINKRSEEIQKSLSGLSTFVQESFSGIRVLKSFVREYDNWMSFKTASDDYKDKSLKLAFVNALFFPLVMGLVGLSVILTVYIGGIEVINGSITTGNIAEFILYVNMLTWPVTSLGWVTSIVQRAAASQKRINEFLNNDSEVKSLDQLEPEIKGNIAFENVSFTYPDSGIQALKNISFEIKSGESLAVIGTTGSGKSTLANLLCRLYDPQSGKISIEGIDSRYINLSHLRKNIGYVPQDVFLFSETIQQNISFSDPNLPMEAIEKAAKDADLLDNIMNFPNGFDTKLGERGVTLSGGQKQRVSIARALVQNPNILILDDCLSAVDTKTENLILNSLKKYVAGRTSIIISHRVSSAQLADKIIVLDDGQISEMGTQQELLSLKGEFYRLYNQQLKDTEVSS
ncbi:MAG: ABC transporter ATP-binding protein/permease [Cyclobacteriaceae bacterium]|nr:ABC transporter ATP-binding protein [Cyclobacteriaceae bacterium]MCH8515505.1 ABC transporter ATP-binding protein/permease [Cyclobacteriaceae bacterium]